MEERKGKERKKALFQSFRDCFSLQKKKEIQWFQGKEKGKKEEKKDEVDGLEDGIFKAG